MTPEKIANANQSKISIITTVKTPLGFFVLTVLIVEAILAATVTFGEGVDRTLLIVGMFALIFLLVVVVALLAYKRPYALVPQSERYTTSLDFEGKSAKDINFSNNGKWWVYSDDPENIEPIDKGELKLNFVSPGAWIWKLPISFKSNCTVKMEVIDDDNQTWLVNERPNITITARKKKGGS
jgi:hypothetical protein